MVTKAKIDRAAEATTFVNAVTANYPDTQTWSFQGTTYKRGDLINLANAYVAATQKTKADHDQWIASADAEQKALETLEPVLIDFEQWLELAIGRTNAKLTEYGFAPERPRVQTAASKAASAAKAKATRAAKKAALAAVAAGSPATPGAGTVPVGAAATPPAGSTGGSKQS
jgi:2',3'-cyclic-nucleotide 2'-phosphodiesterase (5'-nucleotidase family)